MGDVDSASGVSLVGTSMIFPMLGFSVNTLSLLGLVLAIGLVVDDAIVVVEAVEHHIEHGLSPKEATLKAMDEVSGPVIAIALILAAVFVPTAFIPGISGRLYQQFAVTIAISVIISAFNALTLSPALSALLLKPKKKSRGPLGFLFGGFNTGFLKATNGYVGVCRLLIRRSFVTVLHAVECDGQPGIQFFSGHESTDWLSYADRPRGQKCHSDCGVLARGKDSRQACQLTSFTASFPWGKPHFATATS
jgi:hydrophobic/amphiphilic exporter-1 (mainly G- bacteria), HAE1 family